MVISYLSSGTLTSSASAIASTTSVAEAEAVNAQASMLPRADAGSELTYSALPGKSVSLLESTSPALSAAATTSHAAALPEPLLPAGVDEVYRRLDDLSADATRPSHELLDDPLVTATDLSAS